jgi:hypothetical protein
MVLRIHKVILNKLGFLKKDERKLLEEHNFIEK